MPCLLTHVCVLQPSRHTDAERPLNEIHASVIHCTFRWMCATLPRCPGVIARTMDAPTDAVAENYARRQRLRTHVLHRLPIRPRRMSFFQKANAQLDVSVVFTVFTTWRQHATAVRSLRARSFRRRMRWCCDRWHRRAAESAHVHKTVDLWGAVRRRRHASASLRWWRQWTRVHRHLAATAAMVTAARQERLAVAAWTAWRAAYAAQVRGKALELTADVARRRFLLRRCHRTWRSHARLSIRLRQLAELLMNRVLQRRWRLWVLYVHRRKFLRSQHQRAEQHFDRRLLQKAWTAWRWAFNAYTTAREVSRRSRLQRGVTTWRTFASRARGMHAVATRLQHYYDGGVCAVAWRTWRRGVAERIYGRAVNRRASDHARHNLLRRCFVVWRGRWAHTVELRSMAAHAEAAVNAVRLRHALCQWSKWKARHKLRAAQLAAARRMCLSRTWRWLRRAMRIDQLHTAAVRRVVNVVGGGHLWLAFSHWHRATRELASLEIVATAAINDLRVGCALRGWHTYAWQAAAVRRLRAKFAAERSARAVRRAMEEWQAYAQLQRRLRRRFASYIGRRGFDSVHKVAAAWRTELLEDHSRDAFAAAAGVFHSLWKCRRALRWWRRWHVAEQRGHAVKAACERRLVVRVMQAWEVALDIRRTHGNLVERLESRVARRKLRRAVRQWSGWSSRRTSLRQRSTAVALSAARRLAGRTWGVWHKAYVRSRLVHLMAAKHRADHEEAATREAFRTWKRKWRRLHDLKELLAPALVALDERRTRRAFTWWAGFARAVVDARDRRNLADDYWRERRLRLGVRTWRAYAVKARTVHALEAEAVWNWQHAVERRAFRQLRRYRVQCIRQRASASALRAAHDARVVASAWAAWQRRRALYAKYKRRRERLDALKARRQRRIQRVVLTLLADHARVQRRAKRVLDMLRIRNEAEQMAESFECIRVYAAHRRDRRAAMHQAAFHWGHYRKATALQRWRAWARRTLHTRTVLRRVAGHFRHNCAAKAMNAWVDYVAARRAKQADKFVAIQHWQQRQRRSALRHWHAWASLRRQLAWAVGIADDQLLRRCFGRWQRYLLHRRDHKDGLALAGNHWRRRCQHRALRHMHGVAQGAIQARHLREVAVGAFMHATLRRAFTTWELNAEFSRRLRAITKHHLDVRKSEALQWWAAYTRDRAVWAANCAAADRMVLQRALRLWKRGADVEREFRSTVQGAMSRLALFYSHDWRRACFNAWAVHTKWELRIAAAQQTLLRSAARRSLRRWVHGHRTNEAVRRAGDVLQSLTQRGTMNRAWGLWREYIAIRCAHRQVVARADAAVEAQLARLHLRKWHSIVAREREVKGASVVLAVGCFAALVTPSPLTCACLLVPAGVVMREWKRMVLSHRQASHLGEQLEMQHDAKRLLQAWKEWRMAFDYMRRATAIIVVRERRTMRRVLDGFKAAVTASVNRDANVAAIAHAAGVPPPPDVVARLRRPSRIVFAEPRAAGGVLGGRGSTSGGAGAGAGAGASRGGRYDEEEEGAVSDDWKEAGSYSPRMGPPYSPPGVFAGAPSTRRSTSPRPLRHDDTISLPSARSAVRGTSIRSGAGGRSTRPGRGDGDGDDDDDYHSFGSMPSRGGATAVVAASAVSDAVRAAAACRNTTVACLGSWRLFPAAKAFRTWHEVSVARRAHRWNAELARGHYERTSQVKTMRHWRGVVAYQRAVAMAIAYRAVKVKRNVMASLRVHAFLSRNRRALLDTAATHHVTQRLSGAVAIWRRWTQAQLWLKDRERVGYRRHLLRVQATFWHAWCLVTATRKERRLQDLHAYVAV